MSTFTSRPMTRRTFLGMIAASTFAGLVGCGSQSNTSTSQSITTQTSATSASSVAASATSAATTTATPPSQMSLAELLAQTEGKFSQISYTDPETGTTIEYNLSKPDGYDGSKSYPMVTFIADATSVGRGTAFSLEQGYGGIVWASDYDQALHPSYVLVPVFDSTIIDDYSGATKTDLLDVAARLISSVASSNSVDATKLYATGQSMGCMTMLYLAANHPDLFAAEMFVDGQWDVSEIAGLSSQRFCYFAAGGDQKASQGQANVEAMLDGDGVAYAKATLDATQSADEINAAAKAMLDEGKACNFPTWVAGTVMSANPGKNMEHMASFDPAYKVDVVRSWLFEQA